MHLGAPLGHCLGTCHPGGQLCCPPQPTTASAPCALAEHPQGVPALGLVAVPEQGSAPGPPCSPTPSGTGPACSLTTALSIPPCLCSGK